jgi:hypothetical protein
VSADGLRRQYEATRYRIDLPDDGPIDARIGERNTALDALLRARGCRDGVFITAWNPQSRLLDRATNEGRNAELARALDARPVLPHRGIADAGDWEERGFFVLDLPCEEALSLARRFGQIAIVHVALGHVPVLCFTEEASDDAR